jgi:putative transport protein
MAWLWSLLTDRQSLAGAILVLALAIVLGLAIGNVRLGNIRFGVAGVLFSGLILGHFGLGLEHAVSDFAREFGLVLFIYAVGMAVGPGFFNLFRAYGLRTNGYAVAAILLGAATAWLSVSVGGTAPSIAVGVLAGATTNTPSLAAATQTLREQPPDLEEARAAVAQIGVDAANMSAAEIERELGKLPGLGYAVAYPSGVIGIILSFLILRRLFGIDPVKDSLLLEQIVSPKAPPLERRAVRLTRADLAGKTIDELTALAAVKVVVSRIRRDGAVSTALGETRVAEGDLLSVVGAAADVERFGRFAGEPVDLDEFAESGDMVARWIVISRRNLVGRTVADSGIPERFHVRLTRVRRGDTEILSFADFRLAFGDELMAVGGVAGVALLAEEAGDVRKEVEEPHLLPMFFGIALGVIVGSIPLAIPGLAAPVKIGLAGGPLLIALAFSHFRRVGRLVFYLPRPANTALKELGIAVFLAAVGLKSGGRFVATLTQGDGVWWLAWGAAITLVPLLVVGIAAIALFRAPYTAVVGLLAGAMTDPPALAFANSLTKSEMAAPAYATVYPTAMILRVVGAQVFLAAAG